jgi:major membrane immunogen (membrane-anchored lipoprotein)
VPGTHRKKVATVHTPKVVLPTATAQPTATLQSSTLQAQSSSSTDVVSGATGQ